MFDAIRFSGYKSFPPGEEIEISNLEYVSLFIGKNNCGKSSVLDVIGAACEAKYYRMLPNKPNHTVVGHIINKELIDEVLQHNTDYRIPFAMQRHIGENLWMQVHFRSGYSADSIRIEEIYDRNLNPTIQERFVNWQDYANRIVDGNNRFTKIAAERNIVPEGAVDNLQLLPDGRGATNVIRNVINNRKYDETLVEMQLLKALNEIMGSDAQFESIRVQEIGSDEERETLWEVYLQEKGSTRFPLSQSGSGLKTIILVLLNLIVLPAIDSSHTFVYAFEELENNLHPALQRRLYEYIYDYATTNQKYILLTTHSHVAINMFFGKSHTVLYHVIKNGRASVVKQIENYLDKIEILDDLDVKASDLLQANGIIWVEGPSDRIYIKRWLEVFGGNDVQEGRDYQFAYYGGRLLSHYSTEEDAKDLINILLINRNSAIVIDSDKRSHATSLNATKKRVISEFQEKKLFAWVTKGKEIENYVAYTAINDALGLELQEQCKQYKLFPDYIDKAYKNFTSKKVEFASKVKETIDNTIVLDLDVQIKKLYQVIRSWNK